MSSCKYKTVYLHCGFHKTGTSFIQSVLNSNTEALLRAGVHFPKFLETGNHSALSKGCDDVRQQVRKLKTRLKLKSSAETLLLSGEGFTTNRSFYPLYDAVKEITQAESIKAIVYLRRQDIHRESAYAQAVTRATRVRDVTDMSGKLLSIVLKKFIDTFGFENVILRPYTPSEWVGGELLSDFLSALSIESALPNIKLLKEERVNLTLNRNEVWLLSQTPTLKGRLMLSELFEKIPLEGDGFRYFTSPDDRRKFLEGFMDDNDKVGGMFGIPDMAKFLGYNEDRFDEEWEPFNQNSDAVLNYIHSLGAAVLGADVVERIELQAERIQRVLERK